MTVLQIIQPDNPSLRKQAQRVTNFGAELQALIDNMIDTLSDAQGVGLAAPQVAQSYRVILARLHDDEESRAEYGNDAGKLYVVVNPTISKRSEEMVSGEEGCLSLPGLIGEVVRHQSIEVTGQHRDGTPVRYYASGWLARIFQHEIDHLDGVLYIDVATRVWRPEEEDEEVVANELIDG